MQPTNENANYLQIRSGYPGVLNVKSKPLLHGRFLIGSSENCDIVIQHSSVHAIHAVLEIFPETKKIYDLTGEGLLKINGEAKILSDISLKDKITLAGAEIILDQFYTPPDSPTMISSPTEDLILDYDEVLVPPVATPKIPLEKIENDSELSIESVKLPYLIYPFNSKFNFDQSEYIFEDGDQVVPIFKYDAEKVAVEVMILFKKKIMSVDKENAIEYAYLSALEQVDFVEYKEDGFYLSKLDGYKVKVFTSTPLSDSAKVYKLTKQDIIQFELEDISIVVRYVEAPPLIAKPPMFSKDPILFWLWGITFLLLVIPAVLFSLVEVKKKKLKKRKHLSELPRFYTNRNLKSNKKKQNCQMLKKIQKLNQRLQNLNRKKIFL